MEVYFDLEGMRINGSTIPTDIITTLSRPDLVIIDRAASPPVVYLYELSVSYERAENTENAHSRKNNRYAPLVADIEARGFKCIWMILLAIYNALYFVPITNFVHNQ